MRTSSLILVLLAALPLCAFADEGEAAKSIAPSPEASECTGTCPDPTRGGGNFEKLEAMFNTGMAPYFPNPGLVGFAGRCFAPDRDSAVKGAAYLSFNDPSRNGPIDIGARRIASIWSDDVTRYDDMATRYAAQGATWYPACVSNGSLTAALDRTTSSFLRANGNYYIEKVADPSGVLASYYCYYYLTMAP